MADKLFMTGGTGLVGRWLIGTLKRDHPDIEITVLTRDPEKNRHLGVTLLQGDVETFEFPEESYRYIVHAAVASTDRLLEMCRRDGSTLLYTSSGAVYGKGEKPKAHIEESTPFNLDSEYAIKKGMGENLCLQSGLDAKIVRLFTFAGGGQPLDYHYAIGNFIRDGLRGGPVVLRDGNEVFRSYMHYSEMAEWLLAILFNGRPRYPYNVGSEQVVSITQLAFDVAREFDCPVSALPAMTGNNRWYIPSTRRAREELGLVQRIYYPAVMYQMIKEVSGGTECY